MVGGGIYIALGVVVAVAAQWAWLSFAVAGLVAVTSAYSYATLANHFEESGGAFTYLREINRDGVAGSLSWMLILGYVLTMAVYAYAFGHYLAYALGAGSLVTRGAALAVMAGLVGVNLMGAGQMKTVEVVIVTGNLVALLALAGIGLAHWDPVALVAGIEPRGLWSVPIGAASIFMAYEGFQLLTYEYDELRQPESMLTGVLVSAVVFVIVAYAVVALGATMLIGAATAIEEKQVALSVAAEAAVGTPGLVVMTVAAAFATAAAINSTLFSTAQLTRRVASDGELPAVLEPNEEGGVPSKVVIGLGVVAAGLAALGSLSTLVEAASLAFLFTFGTVNGIAMDYLTGGRRAIPAIGIGVAGIVGAVLIIRLALTAFVPLSILVVLTLLAIIGRPTLLRHVHTDDSATSSESTDA